MPWPPAPATQELLEKCNPLGMFDAIASLAVAQNMRDLYRLVRRRQRGAPGRCTAAWRGPGSLRVPALQLCALRALPAALLLA